MDEKDKYSEEEDYLEDDEYDEYEVTFTQEEIDEIIRANDESDPLPYIIVFIGFIGLTLLLIYHTKIVLLIALIGFILISLFAVFSGVSNVVKGTINRNKRYNDYHDD